MTTHLGINSSQRLLFDVMIGIKKLELQYIRGYNQTVPSLSGKAFEEVIRAANMPTRNKEYAPDATGAAELRAMVAGYSILFPLVPGVRIEAVNSRRLAASTRLLVHCPRSAGWAQGFIACIDISTWRRLCYGWLPIVLRICC